MDAEKARRTFPCYKDKNGKIIFDITQFPTQAKQQDITTAYRICRNGSVDDKAFLPSYFDVHSKDMDLTEPSSFSTSCFEDIRDAKKRLVFFGRKNPQAIIAKGYIKSESGYTLRHNDKVPKPKKEARTLIGGFMRKRSRGHILRRWKQVMRNKNYFTDIPNVGDLDLEKVLFEDICPIFFTLISKEQKRYIGVCCELYGEQRWLISPISNSNLIRMLKDEISMREAFLTQDSEKCVVAHWSKENPTLRYDLVDTCDLPKGDLPLDEYLESEDDEIAEYIKTLEKSDTATYTFEIFYKIQKVFSKLLSSSIVYKPLEPTSGVLQEEQFEEITYICEYSPKRV